MESESKYERAVELVEGLASDERLRLYAWLSLRMGWNSTPKTGCREERLQHYVEVMNGIVGADIRERSRKREIVVARNIVMHRMLVEGATQTWVGEQFGMGHCAVIVARRMVENMLMMPRAYMDEMTIYRKFNDKINENGED